MKRIAYALHIAGHLRERLGPDSRTCPRCSWPWASFEWYRVAVWQDGAWRHFGADPEKVR